MSVQLDQHEVNRMRDLLFHKQYTAGPHSNFAAQLFDLFHKADPQNYARLKLGFPEAEFVYNEWFNFPTESGYFERHGFNTRERRHGRDTVQKKEDEKEGT